MKAGTVVARLMICLVLALAMTWLVTRKPEASPDGSRSTGNLEFHRDVAPIVHRHCSGCHREGGSGPFSLVSYQDVEKRANQVAYTVGTRFMPPWPPEPDYGTFRDPRLLSPSEIEVLQLWARQGAREGDGRHRRDPPVWSNDWPLGPPDLVLTMPEPFPLGPDGPDVYRSFVVPVPFEGVRWVKAVAFRANQPRAVHHVTLSLDRSSGSRQLDARDQLAGFQARYVLDTVTTPRGYFVGDLPGKVVRREPEGMAWPLEGGSDIVLELHLWRTGKAESVQMSMGFYFTDEAPTIQPGLIRLASEEIDIPAGSRNVVVEDRYILPVDATLLSIWPHAHYLGKDLRAFATLPDGTQMWLFWIRNWNFNWQDQYSYDPPLELPRGTILSMRFIYDNTSENVQNPHDPPQRVLFGPNSADEMANLWMQVLPRDPADLPRLEGDFWEHELEIKRGYARMLLANAASDQDRHFAHYNLGLDHARRGEDVVALDHFRQAVAFDPADAPTHHNLATVLERAGERAAAEHHYREAIRLDPRFGPSHAGLGRLRSFEGDLEVASRHYQDAVRAAPADSDCVYNLGVIQLRQGRLEDARTTFETAIGLSGRHAPALNNLGNVLVRLDRHDEAGRIYERALQAAPEFALAWNNLGVLLAMQSRLHDARDRFGRALEIDPDYREARTNLADVLAALGHHGEARRHYERVLESSPENGRAREGLERVTVELTRRLYDPSGRRNN